MLDDVDTILKLTKRIILLVTGLLVYELLCPGGPRICKMKSMHLFVYAYSIYYRVYVNAVCFPGF